MRESLLNRASNHVARRASNGTTNTVLGGRPLARNWSSRESAMSQPGAAPIFMLSLLFGLISADCYAEDRTRGNAPETTIEELTVVGERDRQTLTDESHSVVVFHRDTLRLATQRTFSELFERIPNASSDARGESVIRGIPQYGVDNGGRGAAPTTSFFRDGLGTVLQPVLWDTETAEVSRGPQNKLRPSVGGVLAVGTTDPSRVPSGRARASWAPRGDDREFGLAAGGPLSERWSGRLSIYDRQDDGHTENITRNDDAWDSHEEQLGLVKLLWEPAFSPRTTVKILGEYIARERSGSAEVRGSTSEPSFDPFDRYAIADADVGAEETSLGGSIDITHDFEGPWLINFAAGGYEVDRDSIADADGTERPGSILKTVSDFDAYGVVFYAVYEGENWLVRFRQRASHFTSALRQDNIGPFDIDGPGPLPGIVTNTAVEVPWPDFYGWTSHVSLARDFGRFRIAGSLTWEGDTTGEDFSIRSTVVEPTGIPPLDDFYSGVVQTFFPQVEGRVDADSSDLLPMLSISFSPDERTILGLKWERARRAGGVTVNIARRTLDTYAPEISDTYDLFVRASRFDGRLSLSVNTFVSRIRDLQLNALLSTVPLDNQIINARRSETMGLEASAAWVEASWSAYLAIGLLDTDLKEVAFGINNFNGNEYPYAAKWSVSLGGSYDTGNGFFAAFDVSAQGDAEGTFDNRPGTEAQARVLMNARVGWRWDGLSVSLYGRNLLDDEYFLFRDLGFPSAQNQVFYPGDPREIGLTIEVDW